MCPSYLFITRPIIEYYHKDSSSMLYVIDCNPICLIVQSIIIEITHHEDRISSMYMKHGRYFHSLIKEYH